MKKKRLKPKKHDDALEAGFCTAPRCRQFVLYGDGIQVWDEKRNVFDRFCWACYKKSLVE
jgi:hypothetical protein